MSLMQNDHYKDREDVQCEGLETIELSEVNGTGNLGQIFNWKDWLTE